MDGAETRRPAEAGRGGPGQHGWRATWRRGATMLGISAAIAASAFVGGFLVFADQVTRAQPPSDPHADGIVALTGGPRRIDDAVALLGRGSAERLLISGVHQSTSAATLAGGRPHHARLFQCCIDIGYQALDTRGNAAETGAWARRRGYDSLIIVTSAFHMPRSLAEIQRALPEVELVPYPVQDEDGQLRSWPTQWRTFRLLFTEYVKYVAARLV
jgi:uncharacterized SAM-binding protein YcdF (DUF218 family)